jgi:hypothetical protein
MWLWLKTKFALMMVALGLDWPNMPDGDKLQAAVGTFVGFIGVGVGIIGIFIGYYSYQVSKRQGGLSELSYDVSRRQGELAEKQDKYLEDQISRMAKLELRLFRTDDDYKFFLGVTNSGNKTARDFYWQFMRVVADLTKVEPYIAPLNKEETLRPYVTDRYVMSSGYISTPLYPGRSIIVAVIRVPREFLGYWRHEDRSGLYPYVWAVSSEDGRFPPDGWGELPLEPSNNTVHPEYRAELFQ